MVSKTMAYILLIPAALTIGFSKPVFSDEPPSNKNHFTYVSRMVTYLRLFDDYLKRKGLSEDFRYRSACNFCEKKRDLNENGQYEHFEFAALAPETTAAILSLQASYPIVAKALRNKIVSSSEVTEFDR